MVILPSSKPTTFCYCSAHFQLVICLWSITITACRVPSSLPPTLVSMVILLFLTLQHYVIALHTFYWLFARKKPLNQSLRRIWWTYEFSWEVLRKPVSLCKEKIASMSNNDWRLYKWETLWMPSYQIFLKSIPYGFKILKWQRWNLLESFFWSIWPSSLTFMPAKRRNVVRN